MQASDVAGAPSALKILEDAQLAHRSCDFINALKFYRHFFDHALDDDPIALYGVRLNHCLRGWAKLAREFPGAMNQLEEQKQACLENYRQERHPELFHDYWAICQELEQRAEAVATFVELHTENPKSAAKLSKYVWTALVTEEHWEICNELLPEPIQKLDECFAIFDESNQLATIDAQFDSLEFSQHISDQLIDDVQNLVSVLRHGDRAEELDAIQRDFFRRVESRNHSALSKSVNARGAFLFSAH